MKSIGESVCVTTALTYVDSSSRFSGVRFWTRMFPLRIVSSWARSSWSSNNSMLDDDDVGLLFVFGLKGLRSPKPDPACKCVDLVVWDALKAGDNARPSIGRVAYV